MIVFAVNPFYIRKSLKFLTYLWYIRTLPKEILDEKEMSRIEVISVLRFVESGSQSFVQEHNTTSSFLFFSLFFSSQLYDLQ